jgi:hypothetical protein
MLTPDDDEIRFRSVIKVLKHTSKIVAPPGFEADLMRKINSHNYDESKNVGWWVKLLSPSRLIPSFAAVTVIVVFIFLNFNSIERENPFFATPKMRETLNTVTNSQFSAASLNQSFEVNKDGLNFLQIRMTDADRTKINKLKAQIRDYLKENLSGKK